MRTCTVPGCGRKAHAKGLCCGHYERSLVGADLHAPLREYRASPAACLAPGCRKDVQALGYCMAHYARFRRGRSLTPRVKSRSKAKRGARAQRPAALPEADHPLLVELLDLLEPEMRANEGVLEVAKRWKRSAEELHEMTLGRTDR